MQLNDHLYFDLEIEGYDKKDFLTVENFRDFQMIETAGTSLPIFYVAFLSYDSDIVNHINMSNTVIIKLGETKEDADTFVVKLKVKTPPSTSGQGLKKLVELGGYILNSDYMNNFAVKSYYGNSLLVTQQTLYDYFNIKDTGGFKTNITRTNENQVIWRRCNVTACRFLAETLVHMDIMPSFPLFAFDKYGTFHLNSYSEMVKKDPVAYFVARPPKDTNEIQYVESFNVEDFSDSYNLYSGFNKVTEVWGATKGVAEYVKSYNKPILASTQKSDLVASSSTASMNTIQSANVHNTYVSAFVYNTNKLVSLSSMNGALQLVNKYYKHLKPTDIVHVSTEGMDKVLDGSYIIDTIRTQIDKESGILKTYVYVTRDNKNNLENYIIDTYQGLKIRSKFWADLANAVSRLRVAYAAGLRVIDGRFMKELLSFAVNTKAALLRSFVVAGTRITLGGSSSLMNSLIATGNALMNTLLSMIFPEQIATTFRDFLLLKPTLRALLSNYIAEYVPFELQDIISAIIDSLFTTTSSLNSIAKDNGIRVGATESTVPLEGDETVIDTTDTSEIDYISESQKKVNNIITTFENNTTGLNIPFPIIELTESQALMPEPQLREYVASETIANLTNLGYLNGVDKDKFNDILLGNEPIDFNIIDQINKNAGDSYNYRLWGTYNDLTELTSFYIKKCYKDKYRTIPCTKLINATDNIKIFFTCPTSEQDLKFYINSKRVELPSFEISLGYTDAYGNKIPYTVYYTEVGYNSNSVLFEVKQGGMV